VDSGFGNSIYWTLPVATTVIHFTTLWHINQGLVFSVRYRFRLLTFSYLYCSGPRTAFFSKSKSHCDWRSVNQLVLVSSPIWGSWPDIYYCLTVTGLFLWCALSDERTCLSLIYAAGPRQRTLSDPSSLGFVTIFYCLRFETSLSVASYDSQGHGGGIRTRLHTGGFLLLRNLPLKRVLRRLNREHLVEQLDFHAND
jgi:hypothetical protein